jgi:hypothetical protein
MTIHGAERIDASGKKLTVSSAEHARKSTVTSRLQRPLPLRYIQKIRIEGYSCPSSNPKRFILRVPP